MSFYFDNELVPFEILKGKVIKSIDIYEKNCISFLTKCGRKYEMRHMQDCCENVYIEDINGNINDLLDQPILMAEEVNDKDPEGWVKYDFTESYTWTFYKLATVNGYVTIRWYGESNGYYSESVNFYEVK